MALTEDDVATRAAALGDALYDVYGPLVESFTMDLALSGQFPYRIVRRERELPIIGQAEVDPASLTDGQSSPTEPGQ